MLSKSNKNVVKYQRHTTGLGKFIIISIYTHIENLQFSKDKPILLGWNLVRYFGQTNSDLNNQNGGSLLLFPTNYELTCHTTEKQYEIAMKCSVHAKYFVLVERKGNGIPSNIMIFPSKFEWKEIISLLNLVGKSLVQRARTFWWLTGIVFSKSV